MKQIAEKQIAEIGSTVKCTTFVRFTDGTSHKVGQTITVTELNFSYINLFLNKGYKIISE